MAAPGSSTCIRNAGAGSDCAPSRQSLSRDYRGSIATLSHLLELDSNPARGKRVAFGLEPAAELERDLGPEGQLRGRVRGRRRERRGAALDVADLDVDEARPVDAGGDADHV